jgi:hypothetical protein
MTPLPVRRAGRIPGPANPPSSVFLEWSDQVSFIRDYGYAGYVAAEAELQLDPA